MTTQKIYVGIDNDKIELTGVLGAVVAASMGAMNPNAKTKIK